MRHFTDRLINSARVKLALTYLVIIMVLSAGFSSVFYVQSAKEATNNLNRQSIELKDYLYFATPEEIQNIQDGQLKLFKKSLIKRLTALNVGMFVLGSFISLLLAKITLRPLADALEAQSRFSSDAAHELRTPLTAMKTEIEVALRNKSIKKTDLVDVLKSSLEEVAKLESLTSALLRLARDYKKVDKSYWQNYRIDDILSASIKRQQEKAAIKNIKIKHEKTDLTVYGDPDQLVELFVTLIANAVKYSHEGSEIDIRSYLYHDRSIKIEVCDSGIGITDIDLPHIFDRFYRADTSRNKTNAEGYGLGLSLAESIAKQHEGIIQVKSKYKKGSVFSVILPN